MCGDVMACAGTCSQAQSHEPPQKLEELRQLKRGFPGFLLSTKVKKNHRKWVNGKLLKGLITHICYDKVFD